MTSDFDFFDLMKIYKFNTFDFFGGFLIRIKSNPMDNKEKLPVTCSGIYQEMVKMLVFRENTKRRRN